MDSSGRPGTSNPLLRLLVRVAIGCAISFFVIAWASSFVQDATWAIRLQQHPNGLTIGFDSFGWFWSRDHSPRMFLMPLAKSPALQLLPYRRSGAFMLYYSPTPRLLPYQQSGAFLSYYSSATPKSEWNWIGAVYRKYSDRFSTISILYFRHGAVLGVMVLLISARRILRRCAPGFRHGQKGQAPSLASQKSQ